MAAAIRTLVQIRKMRLPASLAAYAHLLTPESLFTNQRLIVSVESGWRSPEGDMIEQFITPSESCLREKSLSRNAEQVRSPLISLLLGGCRGVRTCVFDVRA